MTAERRSAGSWPDLVHIVAKPPRPERRGLGKLAFVGWLIQMFSGEGWEWAGGGGESRPTSVVVEFRGREHRLFREDSFEVAKEKCNRIAAEYDAMSRSDWCRRYGVPEDFFR